MLYEALSFLIAFGTSYILVPLLCKIAYRYHIIDKPDNLIKKHEKATPYLGGVAVFSGFLAGITFFLSFNGQVLWLLLGLTMLLVIGLIDDLFVMKPSQKFFGQFLAALCFLYGGLFFKETTYDYWVLVPVSLFWLLAVPNAINLVDIMDGLATTIAITASITFFCITQLLTLPIPSLLLASFIGALSAFFCFNRPVAQIYLGDAGSLFLGGFLATIPFLIPWSRYNPYGLLVPLVILAIPALEVITLIIIRTYKGIPFYRGSRDHFAHYLQAGGWHTYGILGYCVFISFLLLLISLAFFFSKISLAVCMGLGAAGIILWYGVLFLVSSSR